MKTECFKQNNRELWNGPLGTTSGSFLYIHSRLLQPTTPTSESLPTFPIQSAAHRNSHKPTAAMSFD